VELEGLSHAPSSSRSPTRMSNPRSELGTCPFCGAAIPAGAILVKYEVEGESTSECISSPLSAQNMGEIAGACGYRHMECGYIQSWPVVLINRSETEVNDRNRFLNRSRSGAANPRPQTPLADLPVSDVQGSSIVLRFTSGDTDSQHNHFTGNPRQSNSN